jgi:hypothetical protein
MNGIEVTWLALVDVKDQDGIYNALYVDWQIM